MPKTRLDISCESLDLYFARHVEKITDEGKEVLPRDLAFKLFRKGGEWDSKSTSKLGFVHKLFILLRSLKKRFFLLIEDNETGIGIDQFLALREAGKHREYTAEACDNLIKGDGLILANKELSDYFQYLNYLSTSPAYNFLVKNKNVPQNKVDIANKEMAYIVRFLIHWEGHKKDLVANTGLSIPEVFVLMSLFNEDELQGSVIYKDWFRRSYQSSPAKLKLAFGSLQQRGYIAKYGTTRGAKLQITALGKEVLREALFKYAVNC